MNSQTPTAAELIAQENARLQSAAQRDGIESPAVFHGWDADGMACFSNVQLG